MVAHSICVTHMLMYVCLHTCIHINICIHIQMHVCLLICIPRCIHSYSIYTYTCIHIYACLPIYKYVYKHAKYMYVCTHKYIETNLCRFIYICNYRNLSIHSYLSGFRYTYMSIHVRKIGITQYLSKMYTHVDDIILYKCSVNDLCP